MEDMYQFNNYLELMSFTKKYYNVNKTMFNLDAKKWIDDLYNAESFDDEKWRNILKFALPHTLHGNIVLIEAIKNKHCPQNIIKKIATHSNDNDVLIECLKKSTNNDEMKYILSKIDIEKFKNHIENISEGVEEHGFLKESLQYCLQNLNLRGSLLRVSDIETIDNFIKNQTPTESDITNILNNPYVSKSYKEKIEGKFEYILEDLTKYAPTSAWNMVYESIQQIIFDEDISPSEKNNVIKKLNYAIENDCLPELKQVSFCINVKKQKDKKQFQPIIDKIAQKTNRQTLLNSIDSYYKYLNPNMTNIKLNEDIRTIVSELACGLRTISRNIDNVIWFMLHKKDIEKSTINEIIGLDTPKRYDPLLKNVFLVLVANPRITENERNRIMSKYKKENLLQSIGNLVKELKNQGFSNEKIDYITSTIINPEKRYNDQCKHISINKIQERKDLSLKFTNKQIFIGSNLYLSDMEFETIKTKISDCFSITNKLKKQAEICLDIFEQDRKNIKTYKNANELFEESKGKFYDKGLDMAKISNMTNKEISNILIRLDNEDLLSMKHIIASEIKHTKNLIGLYKNLHVYNNLFNQISDITKDRQYTKNIEEPIHQER